MGSGQSTPAAVVPAVNDQTVNSNNTTPTAYNKLLSDKPKPKAKRTGIDQVNHKCRKKKAAYEKCVSTFYREQFLAGKGIKQEEECGELFDTYRQCYLKHLKREFFDKKDKKPKEGSVLAEELVDIRWLAASAASAQWIAYGTRFLG